MACSKKKKDILFLCQFFYPEYVSSATLPWDTAKALTKAGFLVDALCGYPKEYSNDTKVPKKEDKDGVGITRLKYLEVSRIGVLGRLLNYFSFTACCFLNLFRFRHYRAVMVYSNPPVLPMVAVLAKKLWGTRLVYVCYDIYPEIAQRSGAISEKGAIARVMGWINRHLYRNADHVVALATEMQSFLVEHREIAKARVTVIPNWYAKEEVKPPAVTENPLLCKMKQEGGFVVSYLGNMGTCQDMDTILDAVLACEDSHIKFVFAGHGNKVPELKEKIAHKKEVFFFDFLHGEDFRYVLEQSDCFLVSLAEGLCGLCAPSKTYSYMSKGKPILGIMEEDTDIGRDLTRGGAGFVCENGAAEKLLAQVLTLAKDGEKSKAMGLRCRQIFEERYTEDICTTQYVALFEELLRK